MIRELASNICTDIGRKYGQYSVKQTIRIRSNNSDKESRFDLLVLLDADYTDLDTKSKRSLMDQRFDKIHGFVVTEKGECKSQPDAHTINLICSNISGGGSFLLGAYLYCIKMTPSIPQIAFLS